VTGLPCYHNLDQYLGEWIAASGIGAEPEGPLFPARRYGRLTDRTSLPQSNVQMMIPRRPRVAGLRPRSALTASAPLGSLRLY
jgi:integrase/recombinase XerD